MKRLLPPLILALTLGVVRPAHAGETLVLIVSAHSDVEQLDSSLVRKLFLGLTVIDKGVRLRPVLNESDDEVKELFLQNVVSMSESTYDRFVLRQSLLRGQTQPGSYKDAAALISAVAGDPQAVGYAWVRDVVHDPRVRVLRVLWHD